MDVRIFRTHAFRVENLVLGIAMLAFVPLFFFASEYAEISLGESASHTGLYILYFFLGFAGASQLGGRMLDRIGAKRPVVLGCAVAAVGFYLWGSRVSELHLGTQIWCVVLTGAGMGLMLTPANTDAVNRASRLSYGEATGITQTVRNYSASLGLAILGTILVTQLRSRVATSLIAKGLSARQAATEARRIAESQAGGNTGLIPHFIRLDFAYATRSVLLVMAGIMAAATVVAFFGLRRGVQEEPSNQLENAEHGGGKPAPARSVRPISRSSRLAEDLLDGPPRAS
jgi:MFS family permease